ncbi:hypothetical protein MUB04_15895 [Acinetobacter indicus]|uniref:ADP-ribosyltransferase-containing protein n=1 Tax=Acinetobacter TaxID=469 RepID=UPI0015D1C58E|nr:MULTISPECIES: hypothetical protein [Acinetobacter]MCP0918021.1 hypothetical protein [Acinetobacter indicus]
MNAQLDLSALFATENDVRAAYFGTKSWLMAPNGNPSNLTEAQWVQVRTAAFKSWFGDWEFSPAKASKILDENGEPLVVFHGTQKSFEAFDPSCLSNNTGNDGHFGAGFYFSVEQMEAETYGNTLYPVFINIKAPVYDTSECLEPIATHFGIHKEFQSVDKTWLADQITSKDANAGRLAHLFANGMTYEQAWEEFLETGGSFKDGAIDLNCVGDVFENIDKVLGHYDLEFIKENFGEIPEHVKVYGYDYAPRIICMTDMGNCGQAFTSIAKDCGFNGVWANSEVVAFSADQIKSAVANNGQFSSDLNIYN